MKDYHITRPHRVHIALDTQGEVPYTLASKKRVLCYRLTSSKFRTEHQSFTHPNGSDKDPRIGMKTLRVLPIHEFPDMEAPAPFSIVTLGDPGSKTLDALPHRHEFYAIQYVTGGKGQHFIDFCPYDLSPDTLYFISPGQVHFGRFTQPLRGFVLVFMEEFFCIRVRSPRISMNCPFSTPSEKNPCCV